jgi:hypothetical protein
VSAADGAGPMAVTPGIRTTGDARGADCEIVPINSLTVMDSPRLAGVNADHVRLLSECMEDLPPIIVHRATMQVVDGVHRLHAARINGNSTIRVQFFDGDMTAAFVVAVHSNVQHGMPLSLAERTLAGSRIVRSYPQWSDRKIASVAGLSPKTVGAIRARSNVDSLQPDYRVGRDGRVRKVGRVNSRGTGRAAGPDSTPEEVADHERACGPAVEQPGSPVVPEQYRHQHGANTMPTARDADGRRVHNERLTASPVGLVGQLRLDPSLRFTEGGRLLLRLLDTCTVDQRQWNRMLQSMPAHHAATVVTLARECATSWWAFADRLTRQAHSVDFDPYPDKGDVAG